MRRLYFACGSSQHEPSHGNLMEMYESMIELARKSILYSISPCPQTGCSSILAVVMVTTADIYWVSGMELRP